MTNKSGKPSRKPSTKTKTPATSKKKSENAMQEMSSESEEEKSEEEEEKPLTKITTPSLQSSATDKLVSSRISFNQMDLLNPPLPLHFGQWNDRPLSEKHAKLLQDSFQTRSVRSFDLENMIPLVIRKDHLDSSCLNVRSLNAMEAPVLKLNSLGLKEPSIKVAGGRHRFRAVELEMERLSTEVSRLETRLEEIADTSEEQNDMSRALKKTIEDLLKEKKRVCTWGVIIYDEAALLADGEMLATELSRNEKKLHYAESDGENLIMSFRTWRSLKGSKADEYLKSLGKKSNSGLAQVLNHQESREFLVAQDDLKPHFQYTEPFTTAWIKRYLHDISGGVVIYISLYGVSLWKSLLSEMQLPINEGEYLDLYQKALGQLPDDRPEDWDRQAIITWRTVMEPEQMALHYDLLSVHMMTHFRDLDSVLLRTLLTKTPSQAPAAWVTYNRLIADAYRVHMKYLVLKNPSKDEVLKVFMKKVDWFLTDHKDAHYARPMPMLTPNVVLELYAMMQTIEPAIIEFAQWFDPYAEYFYQNHKNSDTPKDLTAHMLRTISTNPGKVFSQPTLAARELAHIPLKHYATFLKLTEDMKVFGPKSVRPCTPPEQKLDVLEKTYPGITEEVDALKKTMKDSKKGGLTGNWVLDFVGIYDWRNGSKIKNVGRDFIRWAIPAYVEVEIVNEYRPTLLKESKAAQYLRFVSAKTLSPFVKPKNQITDNTASYGLSQSYLYPDQLKTTILQPIEEPEVQVTDLLERMKDDECLATTLKELSRDFKKIAKWQCISAKPNSTEMSPQVHTAFAKFIETVTTNAYRLRDMKAEPDLRDVDPLEERWLQYEAPKPIACDLPTVWSKESTGAQVLDRHKAKTSSDAQKNNENHDAPFPGLDEDSEQVGRNEGQSNNAPAIATHNSGRQENSELIGSSSMKRKPGKEDINVASGQQKRPRLNETPVSQVQKELDEEKSTTRVRKR